MEHFFTLTPEKMLGAVETALGPAHGRATGRCLALNSMENRVYDIEMDDGSHVVAKFYRPGRWSRETILEEHGFAQELAAAEVPAVTPIPLTNGSTLAESDDGIRFALFPKVRGRILQELSNEQLEIIGRFLARMHGVGSKTPAAHRIRLDVDTYGRGPLETLERSGLMDAELAPRYRKLADQLFAVIEPMLAGVPTVRVHGDCHLGNVLWTGGFNEAVHTFFLDFDDMLTAPPVQDLWMVIRGRDDHARQQRETLLAAYDQLRAFDHATLRLVEPLRTLRMIHYSAWIARRWADPIFKHTFPDYGSRKYWLDECADLEDQLELIIAL